MYTYPVCLFLCVSRDHRVEINICSATTQWESREAVSGWFVLIIICKRTPLQTTCYTGLPYRGRFALDYSSTRVQRRFYRNTDDTLTLTPPTCFGDFSDRRGFDQTPDTGSLFAITEMKQTVCIYLYLTYYKNESRGCNSSTSGQNFYCVSKKQNGRLSQISKIFNAPWLF